MDRELVDPEVEISDELAVLLSLREVLVGGADDADVHLVRKVVADSPDLAFLEHSSKLLLERLGRVADLVQKDRASIGGFERPDLVGVGAGERALAVSEQLAFQEVLGETRAVHDDERVVFARAIVVDGAGDELLAGARLPRDQDGAVDIRGDPHQIEHVPHRLAAADDIAEAVVLLDLPLQLLDDPHVPLVCDRRLQVRGDRVCEILQKLQIDLAEHVAGVLALDVERADTLVLVAERH